ncbi:hypothetical protein PSPO01_07109 [Paraphaeosphaeria sporulosa]
MSRIAGPHAACLVGSTTALASALFAGASAAGLWHPRDMSTTVNAAVGRAQRVVWTMATRTATSLARQYRAGSIARQRRVRESYARSGKAGRDLDMSRHWKVSTAHRDEPRTIFAVTTKPLQLAQRLPTLPTRSCALRDRRAAHSHNPDGSRNYPSKEKTLHAAGPASSSTLHHQASSLSTSLTVCTVSKGTHQLIYNCRSCDQAFLSWD